MNHIELRIVVPPAPTSAPVLQYRERRPMYETGPYCPGDWGPWLTVPLVVVDEGIKV
jgi:hypothetical protein